MVGTYAAAWAAILALVGPGVDERDGDRQIGRAHV